VRDLTYPPIIAAAKTAFRLLGQKFDMSGTEHVPRTGGVLLAVNHVGYVDFIYGGLAANPSGRKVRFMSKRELFDHKYTGPLMRSLHHIEVDRGAGTASYDTAVDYLRAGEAVGIFPEATISRSMELKEFKTGAVRIAAAAGVPLVPVVLWGTQRMMTKDHPAWIPLARRPSSAPPWRSCSTRRSRPIPPRSSRPGPGGSPRPTEAAHPRPRRPPGSMPRRRFAVPQSGRRARSRARSSDPQAASSVCHFVDMSWCCRLVPNGAKATRHHAVCPQWRG
jgi:1-acyl-sn-glycerol-3-phosphate acyltransferase